MVTEHQPVDSAAARQVLAANRRANHTIPAPRIYPHQWLWDSCFIAMGLATYDLRLAQAEIKSLLAGQWSNGMLPNIIFDTKTAYFMGTRFWQTHRSPAAPPHLHTSGITQPPLVSIAALEIADRLGDGADKVWLREIYPQLLAYHQWLYRDRAPDGRGLLALVHPWESGLDNSPSWTEVLNNIPNPLWLTTFLRLKTDKLLARFRHDATAIAIHQRLSQGDAVKLLYRALLLRRNRYDGPLHLKRSRFVVEDLAFNSILIAANRALFDIATIINETLPSELSLRMQRTEAELEELWDETTGQYYSRHYPSGKLIKTSTVANFLPLFSGALSVERARRLAKLLADTQLYWPAYPVPSVALSSPYFDQHSYWQGPTWLNLNWLIIKGLLNFDYQQQAEVLRAKSLALVENNGFYEYFSPLTGEGLGTANFSWTAALYLHLNQLDIATG